MEKNFIILLIALLLNACSQKGQPQNTFFVPLLKLSGKTISTYEVINDSMVKNIFIYVETILIVNPPKNRDSSWNIQEQYFKLHHKICLTDATIDFYAMRFYDKSDCTEYFIEHAEDPGGFSSRSIYDDCAMKDEEFDFYYERDQKIKGRWISDMKKELFGYEYHDTIYCDYKHTPPWKDTPWIPKPGE